MNAITYIYCIFATMCNRAAILHHKNSCMLRKKRINDRHIKAVSYTHLDVYKRQVNINTVVFETLPFI